MTSSGNDLLRDLVAQMEARYLDDRENLSMSQWIEQNTTLRGRPFSFKGYAWQRAIADDMHPDLSCLKLSQAGMTELQIRKILGWLKRTTAVSAIFTLPDLDLFKKVAQTRVKPIVDSDRAFNMEDDAKAIRSMSTIQLDRSFLYMTPCTEGSATSTPADALFHDELDLSDDAMIGLFRSRLQNSNYRITQRFSTPTFVGYGIDKAYSISDKHEYLCRCTSCGYRDNIPQFTREYVNLPGLPDDLSDLTLINREILKKLDLHNAYVVCKRCRAPLDLGDETQREWVPECPDSSSRGYRIRPFTTSRLDIPYIIQSLLYFSDHENMKGFFNTTLGEPYTSSDTRISEEEVVAVMDGPNTPDISRDQGVFLGADIGQICHLVLGTPSYGVFHFEQVHVNDLQARVEELLSQYNIIAGAVDRHPYTPTADMLREISQGRILPVEYRGVAPISFVKDAFETITHAQVNRTMMLDAVYRGIRRKTVRLCGYGDLRRLLIDQLRDLVRDEQPDKPAVHRKLSGNDHGAHAIGFLLQSMQLKAALDEMMIKDIRTTVGFFGINTEERRDEMLPMRRSGRSDLGMR